MLLPQVACLASLSAAAYHPCSKGQQNVTCACVLADPTYHLLQLNHTIGKNVPTDFETGLCQEIRIFWYTRPEKQHPQQCIHRGGRTLMVPELWVPQSGLLPTSAF